MGLRRGFKSRANALAREARKLVGIRPADPIDPHALAQARGLVLVPLTSFRSECPRVVAYFTRRSSAAFSALTLFNGDERFVVFNDSHSIGRQASNIAHEVSHDMLGHEPQQALDGRGCRVWNSDAEDEADWLAGAILVPEEAALAVVREGLSLPEAAVRYGVSKDLMRWRLNATGAQRRVARGREYGRR